MNTILGNHKGCMGLKIQIFQTYVQALQLFSISFGLIATSPVSSSLHIFIKRRDF